MVPASTEYTWLYSQFEATVTQPTRDAMYRTSSESADIQNQARSGTAKAGSVQRPWRRRLAHLTQHHGCGEEESSSAGGFVRMSGCHDGPLHYRPVIQSSMGRAGRHHRQQHMICHQSLKPPERFLSRSATGEGGASVACRLRRLVLAHTRCARVLVVGMLRAAHVSQTLRSWAFIVHGRFP